jgi:hypothetical protein
MKGLKSLQISQAESKLLSSICIVAKSIQEKGVSITDLLNFGCCHSSLLKQNLFFYQLPLHLFVHYALDQSEPWCQFAYYIQNNETKD